MKKLTHVSLLTALISSLTLVSSMAQTFTGLGTGGASLVQFGNTGTVSSTSVITGLNTGDSLVDIDYFTSSTGLLYGISQTGTLYTLSTTGAVTTATVNTTSTVGTPTAIDFNPVANRLRVFAGTNNFRLTPVAGTQTADGTLAYATGDVNQAATPNLVGAAYTNNFAGSTATSLYSLDSTLNILVLHTGTPQFSTLNTLGSLTLNGTGFALGLNVGFDIQTVGGVNTAYLSNGSDLYTVDLNGGVAGGTAGNLTFLGTVATGITDIAAIPEPEIYGLLGLAVVGVAVWQRRRMSLAAQG